MSDVFLEHELLIIVFSSAELTLKFLSSVGLAFFSVKKKNKLFS